MIINVLIWRCFGENIWVFSVAILSFITSELNEFPSSKFGDFYSTIIMSPLLARPTINIPIAKGGDNYGFYLNLAGRNVDDQSVGRLILHKGKN